MREISNLILWGQADGAIASRLGQLGATPYVVLAIYLLVLLVLGVYGWLRSRAGEEDYYLAGRRQGWMVSSLTIMATFFSSFALLGAPGMVYREGVVFALFSLNVPVSGICVYLLGSRIWKLGRRFGYITPGDMIADYYGSRYSLRLLVALTGFLYAIPYVVMQIQAGGIVSEKLFPGPGFHLGSWHVSSFALGCTVLAAITMLYIMIGGMRSVAWTDVVQGSLLIGGMLVSGLAMILVFGSAEDFSRRVMTELPEASLTSPGTKGSWPWTMVLSVCLLASTGSMVQPAQWMRYYSARSVATLQRGAVIFAVVLTSCFILGVMLIGLAGQVLYPLRFEYRQVVEQGPASLQRSVPADLAAFFQYEPASESSAAGAIRWSWSGRPSIPLDDDALARLADLDDDPGFQQALAALSRQVRSTPPSVQTAPRLGGDFDSILVVMLNDQLPRVLGQFGALFASLLLVAVMAASMSTADSNLHALSAVLSRDVYDQFVRPQASESERVWVGRLIILLATVFSLALVIAGSHPAVRAKYDFVGMIAMMGLMAIAFTAQLLPLTVDMLFLRRGTGRGAASGLAAGLLGAFLCGQLFPLLVEGFGSPPPLANLLQLVDRLKFVPVHGAVWGLVLNVPTFVLVSWLTRSKVPPRRADYEQVLQESVST